jgi:hypothetical protein
MSASFAAKADLTAKQVTFRQLSANCWAYTAEGDPNSGVIIGDDACMEIDTTATPAMAQDLIARIRAVTVKPIKYVVLSHYHAVRVLGASAYFAEGATEVIASRGTYELIVERGAQDMRSENLDGRARHRDVGGASILRRSAGPMDQQVAGLALQHLADPGQRVEAHSARTPAAQHRDLLLGQSDALGQRLRAHLATREHHVELDHDRHRAS